MSFSYRQFGMVSIADMPSPRHMAGSAITSKHFDHSDGVVAEMNRQNNHSDTLLTATCWLLAVQGWMQGVKLQYKNRNQN
jgi:hypothetical protein